MKKYYVTGNTAQGLVNYLISNVSDLKQVIILKHDSHRIKTAVLQELIDKYKESDMEILLSALGKNFLDGIIVRDKSLAIIGNHIVTSDLHGAIELDLALFIKHKHTITFEQLEKFKSHTEEAYNMFANGLKIHDDLEDIYIKEMNFTRANELADEVIKQILKDKPKKNRQSNTVIRLFGTNTVDGVVNEVPHIIENIKNVYYIKGRAGTGKSTLMKKVALACEKYGYDVERYHCSFDPKSLDMVLVRGLNFCIFDSTDPHEYFPTREGEKTVDIYQEAVTPGTDEKFAKEIDEVNHRYKSFMKKGIVELKKAGEYLELIEAEFSFTEKEILNISKFIKEQMIQ